MKTAGIVAVGVASLAVVGCAFTPGRRGPDSGVNPGAVALVPEQDNHKKPLEASRPAKVIFADDFSEGKAPRPDRWVVRNPTSQRVVVQEGALVVRSEACDAPSRIEFQVHEPLAAMGRYTLEFDALVNSLWGKGQGEVRVELRDFATRGQSECNDFVLAERYWGGESGLKFGVFRGGAFVGWHEVAPVGELGAWHHYRVDYDSGSLAVWRDGERVLECDLVDFLDQPLNEGLAVELGFHVLTGSGVEGCLDNVTIVARAE